MTRAVCLRCGEFKIGAWSMCPGCRYEPDDDESYTKHIIVSDHYMTPDQLDAVSRRVKSGETVPFDPETLKTMWVDSAAQKRGVQRMQLGCALAFVLVIGAIVGIWWLLRQ